MQRQLFDYANLLKLHCTKKREHYIPVVGLGMDKVNPNDIKKASVWMPFCILFYFFLAT